MKIKSATQVFLFSLTLASCQSKYCWDCTISTQMGGYAGSQVITHKTVCDKTKDEIADYEKQGTSMKTVSGGNVLKTDTNCDRQ
jgi:hypothetical protein